MNTQPIPPEAQIEFNLDREVRQLLKRHRYEWQDIEPLAGVSYSWITKFARGAITNPRYDTLKRLHKLLSTRPVNPPVKRRRKVPAEAESLPGAIPGPATSMDASGGMRDA